MRATLLVLVALAVVYCSDPTGPIAPVAFGLISGDGQVAEAAQDSLLEPVVGQAYRDADGSLAFRVLGPRPLHAQTPIGTGVANVLTCAAPIGDHGLTPWQSCRDTDSEGFVVYWFDPGVVAADSVCAEIRATVDSTRTVLATVCASVEPGPVAVVNLPSLTQSGPSPLTMRENGVQDAYGNAAAYDVVPRAFAHKQGDATLEQRRTLVADSAGCAQMSALDGGTVLARGVVIVAPDSTVTASWASWDRIERGDTLPSQWAHGDCWVNSP